MSVALSLILARTNPAGRVYQLGASSARRRPARLQSPRPARPIRAAGATSGKRITCLDAAHPGYGQIETCRASERLDLKASPGSRDQVCMESVAPATTEPLTPDAASTSASV